MGWTYSFNNHAMQSQGLDEKPYTCWAGPTLVGIAGTHLGGMSHSVISINGPWNSPIVSGTDPSDANDAVWRCARFYFRYVGDSSSLKMPLPITGIYNADVDGSNEKRYFPLHDEAGGWMGLGPSDIWIRASSMQVDTISPTMIIAADQVASGDTSLHSELTLRFTSSEDTTTFYKHDVVAFGGSLSSFAGSGSEYTATFTPDSSYGVKTIAVNSETFADLAGNENRVESRFEWDYNSRRDFTIEMSIPSGNAVTNDESIVLLLTLSYAPSGLEVNDLIVYNEEGDTLSSTLSNFQVLPNTENKQYSVNFTPSQDGLYRVQVRSNACTNENLEYNLASNMISWTRDLIAPSITITSLEGNSPIISSVFTNLRLIFTISEDVSGFDINDITVEGGKLSLFSGSSGDSRYEVTLSPDKYVNGETPNGTYTEGAGCPSETQLIANADDCEDARSDLTWGGSINVNNRPSGCIADNTAVYFNSQNVIDQTLIGSDRVVCEKLAGELSVQIQSAAFQDPAGNDNSASNSFEWSFDTVSPILQISHQGIPTKISYLVVGGGGGAASGG